MVVKFVNNESGILFSWKESIIWVRFASGNIYQYFYDNLIDIDINIFQNCLINIDIVIFKNDNIDIFQKCRYIDNQYFLSI